MEHPAQKHWARMHTTTTQQGEWILCELSFTQKCLLLHSWSLPLEVSSFILYFISPYHFGNLAPESYPLSFQQCKSLPLLCFLAVSGFVHLSPHANAQFLWVKLSLVSFPTPSPPQPHPVSPQSLHAKMHIPITHDNLSLTHTLCPTLLPDLYSS